MSHPQNEYRWISPWSSNENNPFSTPWHCRFKLEPCSERLKTVELLDAAGVVFASRDFSSYPALPSADPSLYMRLVTVMNACTKVRAKWDYESTQQIRPFFGAVAKLAKVSATLKQRGVYDKERRVFTAWWNSCADKGWGEALGLFLKKDWSWAAREAFLKNGAPIRAFRYKIFGAIASGIQTAKGENLFLLSYVPQSIWEKLGPIQETGSLTQPPAASSLAAPGPRVARAAYWGVILETMNAFASVDHVNGQIPEMFPGLVAALRHGHGDMAVLAQRLASVKSEFSRDIAEIGGALEKAFTCFDASLNRNKAFLALSAEERKKLLRTRCRVYASAPRA